jgi:drug/metabolite transporter (DMT)-like permease
MAPSPTYEPSINKLGRCVQKRGEKISTGPSTALPTLAMLGAVFLWSSATPGTKSALTEIALAEFVIIRLSLATVALWLIVLVTRTSASLLHVGWRPLIMGLLEPGLVTLLVSLGLTMTSPVSGSVFWGLTPLIMPILGRVVLGERIEFVVFVAAVIAFAGTLILVWGQSHHGGGSVLGDICVASGVVASAVNALLSRRNAQAGANPLVTSSWQLTSACCVAFLLPFVIPPGGGRAVDASTQSIAVLAYLGLVVSVGVYILSNYAIRHIPVGRMSLLGCLTAPFGAMLSAIVLKIEVSTLDVLALVLVVGAVALPSLAQWMRTSPNWSNSPPNQRCAGDQ